MSTPTVDRLFYRPNEAAATTGLSRSRIYELMAQGQLAYRQVGNTRLIPAAALAALGDSEGDVTPAGG